MAGKSPVLSVRIVANSDDAAKGFKQASGEVNKFEQDVNKSSGFTKQHLDKLAVASAATGAAFLAFSKQAMSAASEMEQATGAVHAVYKDQADQVMKSAEGAAKAVGLSAAEYANSAAIMGSQLRNMGIEQDQVAGKTDELIRLGADLASMYGGTTADAIAAIGSLLRGERDPIERYAVGIKQADINARMAAEGLDGLEGEARKQAETQTVLSMLFEQSADALGNFNRESDTQAGTAQIAAAEWENAKAKLGEGLLPIVVAATQWLTQLAGAIGEHPQLFMAATGAVLTFTGAVVSIAGAIKVVDTFKTAFALLNATMAANPIGLVLTAVAALAGALIYAYNTSESFRNAVNWLGRTAGSVFSAMGAWIHNNIVNQIIKAINWVQNLISRLQSAWNFATSLGGRLKFGAAPPQVTGVFGDDIMRFYPEPPVTAALAPQWATDMPLRTSPVEAAPPVRQEVNITINGVLNAEDAAREIRGLLEREGVRQTW